MTVKVPPARARRLFHGLCLICFSTFPAICDTANVVSSPLAQTQRSSSAFWELGDTLASRQVVKRFFASWSGYRNPVTPRNRVSLTAAHSLDVYYECTYERIGGRELLVLFEKYRLQKKRVAAIGLPDTNGDVPFFSIERWQQGVPVAGRPMTGADVLAAADYLFVPKNTGSGVVQYVQRQLVGSREYRYTATGKYVDFVDRPSTR